MHLVISIDSNPSYIKQCFVMLFSLLYHNHTDPIILHIIHTPWTKELFEKQWEHISHFVWTTHVTLLFYEITRQSIEKLWLPVYNNLTLTTYFRLLIPSILDTTIDRCIYLDVDMIVRWSLQPLVEQILLEDDRVWWVMTNVLTAHMDNLWINRYINAWVLIINMVARRKLLLSQQIIDFIIHYPQWLRGTQPIMGDQCGINYICRDHLVVIDPCWNTTPFWFGSAWWVINAERVGYNDNQIAQARTNPQIVHFAWLYKPSDRLSVHPRKFTYYRYLFHSWLVEIVDFLKVIIHGLTYPRRSDRPLFNLTKNIKNIGR